MLYVYHKDQVAENLPSPPDWTSGWTLQEGSLPTTEEILTLNLRFGAGPAAALRTRAFAQIIGKVLYLQPAGAMPPSVDGLRRDMAAVLGVASIGRDRVIEALEFGRVNGSIQNRAGGWTLTSDGQAQIERALDEENGRIRDVLQSHFPPTIDAVRLKAWFHLCCSSYFARFGNRWVAAICRTSPRGPATPGMVETLVAETARSVGLEGDAELLVTGFNAFLNSQHNRDQQEIYALCQAMFAARLVAADVGADPIVTTDLRNSLFIVDTNILFAGALEKHRLAQALLALGRALERIGCRVAFIHLTKLEYQASIDRHREATLRALQRFTLNIVSGASDAIISTAVARGCRTQDDYQIFFEQVADPIEALEDSFPVVELDDAEVDRIAEEGSRDNNLKAEIARVWQAAGRRRTKGESLLRHDAAVMTVAERLNREGRKTWVLTLDRTMQDLSLQRAGPYQSPTCLALDTLVEVLALDEAGPEIQAEEFVPILISMLDFEVGPHPHTYMVHDLMWLLDVEERAAALRDDRLKIVAATVARERLSGRSRNDPELHLIVQRVFQEERFAEAEVSAAENRRQVRELREALDSEKESNERIRDAYIRKRVPQLRRDARARLIATVAVYSALSILVIFSMYKVSTWANRFGEYANIAVLLFGLAAPTTGILWQIGEAFPRYWQRMSSAEIVARGEIIPE